ncbi:hypothetical protein LIER_36391 [Lithospermum erythrorhizon]|uniref:Zinc finger PHD-type domain-containing protein n=1 Tax=Lithospermum erythrorhizon TaxID=34254 RepID=A0AAV3P5F7_LITER
MSQVDSLGCKKRRRTERVFKFKKFGERGYPVDFHGSFLENVRALLEFGQIENGLCGEMASWSFQLEVHRHPSLHIFLFVVEEPIELSLNRHCKHCQYIGWGHHLICNRKYHFFLPSMDTILPCLNYEGNSCLSRIGVSESKSTLIELEGHTMHGVFHSNGFGHLLCVNGMEASSNLAGFQLMDFWDRLCTGLGARKVSLRDVSVKRGMDLRLIHAVAYGTPWFGRWGYTLSHGSYGVDQQTYNFAVTTIQKLPLSILINHLGISNNKDILITLSRYQVLSGHSLMTIGDMFHFMLELKLHLPRESSYNYQHRDLGIFVDSSCRWSPKRVEMAIRVIIDALKRAECRWISRQEVRDIARNYIGDTGLLDFVLKSLGNQVVGRYFVRRCLNPVTKVLEYSLEDVSDIFPMQTESMKRMDHRIQQNTQCKITKVQLMKDVYFLYKQILQQQHKFQSNSDMPGTISAASRIILDSKYMVKEFNNNETISEREVEKLKTKTILPGDECDRSEGKKIVIDCICGVEAEAGERMVSCDICEIWQHTRCVNIPSSEEIPNIFICCKCEQALLGFPSFP